MGGETETIRLQSYLSVLPTYGPRGAGMRISLTRTGFVRCSHRGFIILSDGGDHISKRATPLQRLPLVGVPRGYRLRVVTALGGAAGAERTGTAGSVCSFLKFTEIPSV